MRVNLKPLAEQVIVITGASSGIGLATAEAVARQGAKVVLSSRNEGALAAIEKSIRDEGGEAIHVVADISKREDIEALAAAAIEAYGSFDTWVNNAGQGLYGRLDEVSEEDHRQLFDVNFWGLVNGAIVAAKHLRASGGGAIINLGSVVSDIGFPIQGMYSASKHAINGFTDAFRMEMVNEDAPISVTLIKPSAIDTPFPMHAKTYLENTPTLPPPVYMPQDVAEAILHAAVHGGRDYYIGGGGKLMSALNKHLPGIVDWFGANFVPNQSVKGEKLDRDPKGILNEPGQDGQTRGNAEGLVRRSAYTKAVEHPVLTGAALAALALGAIGLVSRNGRDKGTDS
jgi:short-subunit dehydrogenase